MCLIASSNAKRKIPLNLLENAYENNSDGVGIVYLNKMSGRLQIVKSKGSFEDFKKIWEEAPDEVNIAVHFRFKTHGDLSLDNIHPYEILSKDKGHPIDLVLMHNGIISGIHTSGDARSDTAMYVDRILRPILAENPSLVHNEGFKLLVSRDIGSGNKFLFFDSNDVVNIYNKNSGHEDKNVPDVWFSNSYSIATNTYRKGKSYSSSAGNSEFSGMYGSYGAYWSNRYRDNAPKITEHTVKPEDTFSYVTLELVYPDSYLEKECTKKIKRYLADDEQLLSRTNKVGKRNIGYGWVMKGNKTYTYYPNIAEMHEELDKIRKDESKKVSKVIVAEGQSTLSEPAQLVMDLNSKLTVRDLALYTKAEILEWVCNYPIKAAELLISKGFGGGRLTVEDYVNKNIDQTVDLLYNISHFNSFNPPYGEYFEYPTNIAI